MLGCTHQAAQQVVPAPLGIRHAKGRRLLLLLLLLQWGEWWLPHPWQQSNAVALQLCGGSGSPGLVQQPKVVPPLQAAAEDAAHCLRGVVGHTRGWLERQVVLQAMLQKEERL